MQIVHGSRRGSRDIGHLGSAQDAQAVEAHNALARQRLAGGQGELDLDVDTDVLTADGAGPLQIASSQRTPLWDALCSVYDQLGFDTATDDDEVFAHLVLARIIEPTSKADSLRALAEAGIDTVSYATVKRRLQGYADDLRGQPAGDRGGRVVVHPRCEDPQVPHVIADWRRRHPDQEIPDKLILTQLWPAGPNDHRHDQVIYYQYAADRAWRTLHGVDEQIAKAERAVAGKVPVKRNQFVTLTGAVAHHRPFQLERSFRMSKHDLAARPICHHNRASIEAHLTIVFAALAVSRLVEDRTGWSIRRFVQTARRYRTVQIHTGNGQLLTAAASGETYANDYVLLVREREGRAVDVVENTDTLKMLQYESMRQGILG